MRLRLLRKEGSVFYCSVELFCKREISRHAATASHGAEHGPASEFFTTHKNLLSVWRNGHCVGLCAGQAMLPLAVIASFLQKKVCAKGKCVSSHDC